MIPRGICIFIYLILQFCVKYQHKKKVRKTKTTKKTEKSTFNIGFGSKKLSNVILIAFRKTVKETKARNIFKSFLQEYTIKNTLSNYQKVSH